MSPTNIIWANVKKKVVWLQDIKVIWLKDIVEKNGLTNNAPISQSETVLSHKKGLKALRLKCLLDRMLLTRLY